MPSRIRILDEQLANQIAAGEVVERPASVVKELVENALDADAGRITVETKAGGKSLISVTDDGYGMNRDDLLMALESHATSKIKHSDDLFAIRTMGFRGEAVPAIASVSRMKISSREKGAISGYEVIAEGGDVKKILEAGLPLGTSFEIKALFYNTPARRRFLKSASVEMSHVTDTIMRLAIPRSDVFFEYIDSGNTILRAPASADLTGRIAALLGKEIARSMIRVRGEYDHFSISGFAGSPQILRSGARQIYFFVNKRFVRDKLVFAALRKAYEGHIPKGRYPAVVLFLEIDPAFVDVNVHPAKLEIRFRKGPKVYDGIVDAVQAGLLERFGVSRPQSVFDPVPGNLLNRSGSKRYTREPHDNKVPADTYRNENQTSHYSGESEHHTPSVSFARANDLFETDKLHRATKAVEVEIDDEPKPGSGPYSSLEIVGQFLDGYIVCQNNEAPGSMVIIDQHAAHERILFEKLSADYYNSTVSVQALLLPITLEPAHSDAGALESVLPELKKGGIEIEPFGTGTFRITATPAVLGDGQVKQLVMDCIERVKETGRAGLEGFADELLALLACHSAVRAGQSLTVQQMREILKGLDRCRMPGSCPHGRPTTKELPLGDIERFFGRK